MNIIFLDIDGVLNSLPYFENMASKNEFCELNNDNVSILAKIYHQNDAKIVLSSTWRFLKDKTGHAGDMYSYLIQTLSEYNMQIISITPIISANRPKEIKAWLDNNNIYKVINYIIIDDDFSKSHYDKYGLGDKLIQTKYFCHDLSEGGLQEKHIKQAKELFQNK